MIKTNKNKVKNFRRKFYRDLSKGIVTTEMLDAVDYFIQMEIYEPKFRKEIEKIKNPTNSDYNEIGGYLYDGLDGDELNISRIARHRMEKGIYGSPKKSPLLTKQVCKKFLDFLDNNKWELTNA